MLLLTDLLNFSNWASLIEFAGAMLMVSYLLAALFALAHTGSITRARLLVAEGVLTSLSFKLAGTLLKTIELRTWQQILMFIAILALRTILKRFFRWEHTHLQQRSSPGKDTTAKR